MQMKKSNYLVLASVFGALSLASVQASAEDFFQPKRNEISAYGSIDNQSTSYSYGGASTSSTSETVVGQFGHYFTPQIVGTAGLMLTKTGGTSSTTITDVTVGGKYYFKAGKQGDWTPFVMADVGLANYSGGGMSGTGYMVDAAGGVTYWVTESAGVNVDGKLKRESFSLSAGGASFTQTTNHVMVEFGLTLKF